MLARMADPEQQQAEEHDHRSTRVPAPPAKTGADTTFEAPESPVERLASNIGNRNFRQVVARMADGEGILHDGTVHPDVQAAIAATTGQGSRLDRQALSSLSKTHGDLSDARIHTGSEANQLARSVNAVAFTVGSDIYFRDGAYQPHTSSGKELLAHEAAHVVQQRGAPASGPLQVSNPGDALEREADRIASDASASA